MTTSPGGEDRDPRRDDEEYDARFADIVSRWDEEAAPPGHEPAPAARPGPFQEPVPWREHITPDDEDEGYEPPPPSALPPFLADWTFYLALVGLVVGPLWLVYLVVFAPTEHRTMWFAAALTMAGFVTLVLRQPVDRDPDDHDDGARV